MNIFKANRIVIRRAKEYLIADVRQKMLNLIQKIKNFPKSKVNQHQLV